VREGDSHAEIRAAVARLCADFPGEYWRDLDRRRAYPSKFVATLAEAVSAEDAEAIQALAEEARAVASEMASR